MRRYAVVVGGRSVKREHIGKNPDGGLDLFDRLQEALETAAAVRSHMKRRGKLIHVGDVWVRPITWHSRNAGSVHGKERR